MPPIRLDYSNVLPFVSKDEIFKMEDEIRDAHEMLCNGTGPGSEFLGWLDLPVRYDRKELDRINTTAQKIRSESDALVVIGIGGSYIGARAVIEALSPYFSNQLPGRGIPQIYFAGYNLSGGYMADLLHVLEGKDVSVNVISKSGTTTEPAIAFRILKEYMEKQYGRDGARQRIYATTDKEKGVLKQLALKEGYECFVVPDDIQGRYSVLTPVGLLPIASSGIDIFMLMEGAASACETYSKASLWGNECCQYAAVRNALYRRGWIIEGLVSYEPLLFSFTEWWKQLFGESEGKEHKGIFPMGLNFTTDLHSLGQYMQDGLRVIFETTLSIEKPGRDMVIPEDREDLDQLNYLAGKGLDFVNSKAMEGTISAHVQGGGVPNILLNIPMLDEFHIGSLIYFFEKACGISGYVLGVNPFDQPGVDVYKNNMFRLLGKPGF